MLAAARDPLEGGCGRDCDCDCDSGSGPGPGPDSDSSAAGLLSLPPGPKCPFPWILVSSSMRF